LKTVKKKKQNHTYHPLYFGWLKISVNTLSTRNGNSRIEGNSGPSPQIGNPSLLTGMYTISATFCGLHVSWKMRRRREAGDAGAPACGLVFALTLMLIAEDF
jgi:hypothetical protein